MKKVFVTIGLILGLTTSVFASSYKNVVITNTAANIIKSLRLDNFTKKYVYVNNKRYITHVLHYDDVSSEFEYLSNSDVAEISSSEIKGNMKTGMYMQVNSKIIIADGICRSFTKSLAPTYPNKITRSNYVYQKITPNQKIKYGTIIVSNADKNHTGHVAVLLYVGKDSLWVMDQNSFIKKKKGKGGVVEMHGIKFGKECSRNEKCYYDNLNAYNYHILRYK